ncbi:hypothetical protein LTR85_009996 [Meristemomyces frigidus]|nr:hypothetical protein LTR85_009996 [Meristemomyces frigidus]
MATMTYYPFHPSTFDLAFARPATAPLPYVASTGCSICAYGFTPAVVRTALTQEDYTVGLNGLIAHLPTQTSVPGTSIAHQQPEVLNDRAFDHPCVILSTSDCGHMVFCLPATSWGRKSFDQKWHAIRNPQLLAEKRNLYAALKRHDTVPHNLLGELEHSGPEMPTQTYIHKDHGFWIEWSFLNHFKPVGCLRRLTLADQRSAQRSYSAGVSFSLYLLDAITTEHAAISRRNVKHMGYGLWAAGTDDDGPSANANAVAITVASPLSVDMMPSTGGNWRTARPNKAIKIVNPEEVNATKRKSYGPELSEAAPSTKKRNCSNQAAANRSQGVRADSLSDLERVSNDSLVPDKTAITADMNL